MSNNFILNEKNMVVIGVIIVIVTMLGSVHIFAISKNHNGKQLNIIDTIKNIFGLLPIVIKSSVNTLNNIVDSTSDKIKVFIEDET